VGEALPADSVAYGADWGGNWVNLGYTNTPVSMGYTNTKYKIIPEQLTAPVKQRITAEDLAFEFTLIEMTGVNLALALNGTAEDTAAGVGQVGKTEVKMGGDSEVHEYTFGAEGEYVDDDGNSFPIRLQAYKCTITMNGNLEFSKAKESGTPVRVEAIADTTKDVGEQLMLIQIITADALS